MHGKGLRLWAFASWLGGFVRYGIIDVGSNTIRLCIYQVASGTIPTCAGEIEVLLNSKTTASLANYVKTGSLSEKAIARAARAVNEHLAKTAEYECEQVLVFATAALRNAENGEDARAAIGQACGLPVRQLSGEDEARLGVRGALLGNDLVGTTFVDIGGGSTELTYVEGTTRELLHSVSIPQGTLSSFSMFVKGITPTPAEQETIAYCFTDLYAKRAKDVLESGQVYAVGGALRAAASVYANLFEQPEIPSVLTIEQIEALLARHNESPEAFTHTVLPAVPDRIHTLIPGCVIIHEVLRLCDASEVTICQQGVREGFLIEHLESILRG